MKYTLNIVYSGFPEMVYRGLELADAVRLAGEYLVEPNVILTVIAKED